MGVINLKISKIGYLSYLVIHNTWLGAQSFEFHMMVIVENLKRYLWLFNIF